MTEALNNHFSSVFTIENLGNVPQVTTRVDTVQEELSITEVKLIEILNKLKVDKSPGRTKFITGFFMKLDMKLLDS